MSVIDQIIHAIQASIDELLSETDRLRRALAALTSSAGESARGDRAAPPSGAAGESAAKSSGARTRTPRTSEKPARSAAAPARARTAPGATKAAVLAALGGGNAMTAGEIAAATGLARASVSTTLSKLASSGEIAKAARGYQLPGESDRTRKPPRPRPSLSTLATSPSSQAAEPPVAEPLAVEPQAAEAQAAEPPAAEPEVVEPPTAEPEVVEPEVAEPEVAEPDVVEPEVAEPEVAEPDVAEPPAAEPPAVESQAVEPKAGPARSAARPAPGATKHAVLGALAGGSAMTAGEVAAAIELGRGSVSATLSQLAKAGEVTKAARGYQIAGVEPAQRFYFRTGDDATAGAVVANLPELEAEIAVCAPGALRRHCAEHDFSRWVAGVFQNEPLAADIVAAEAQLSADSPTEKVEDVRRALIAALEDRHATRR